MPKTDLPARKAANIAKEILLAPIYLYQGRKIKRETVRLPEPHGKRHGQIPLLQPTDVMADTKDTPKPALRLMIVGDSAAAGVGSPTQQDALVGQLLFALQQQPSILARFGALTWSLQATTGHTSFDVLRRLYVLPTPNHPVDIMVLSVGVNDTTAAVTTRKWQQYIEEIIAIAQRKFGVQQLIFSCLPPMAHMPAIPAPLSHFIGARASGLDKTLQHVCARHRGVTYMATDFTKITEDHFDGTAIDITAMFASDGFHPSCVMYGYWARQLAEVVVHVLGETAAEPR